MAPGTTLAGFGLHERHQLHPHDRGAQDPRRVPWCQGRWLCLTCTSPELPRGTWFAGLPCVRSSQASSNGSKAG